MIGMVAGSHGGHQSMRADEPLPATTEIASVRQNQTECHEYVPGKF